MRDTENMLRKRFDDWTIEIIPPLMPLPAVNFTAGEATLSDEIAAQMENFTWALKRWHVRNVQVSGFAARAEGGKASKRLAALRADTVAEYLAHQGIKVHTDATYPIPHQSRVEHEKGRAALRKVMIAPVAEKP